MPETQSPNKTWTWARRVVLLLVCLAALGLVMLLYHDGVFGESGIERRLKADRQNILGTWRVIAIDRPEGGRWNPWCSVGDELILEKHKMTLIRSKKSAKNEDPQAETIIGSYGVDTRNLGEKDMLNGGACLSIDYTQGGGARSFGDVVESGEGVVGHTTYIDGLYILEGDKLTWCNGVDLDMYRPRRWGDSRPDEATIVLEREKPK